LKIEGFFNLEKIDCRNNQITELDIGDCPKITKLDIRGCLKLAKFYCSNNQLKKLYLDGIKDTDWEKVQEELKDYLKEKKKKKYYDLKA